MIFLTSERRLPNGEEVCDQRELGIRTWGNAEQGTDVVLTGSYLGVDEVSKRLLSAHTHGLPGATKDCFRHDAFWVTRG